MKYFLRAFSFVIFSFFLAGCATRPVPGNYDKKVSTYGIVQKIRCETRDALSGFLRNSVSRQDPELANRLRNGGNHFQEFYSLELPKLAPRIRNPIKRYWKSAIAFEFTFTIEEQNNLSGGASFSDPFTNGLFKLGVSAGNNRIRHNIRNFKTGDILGELLTSEPLERACQNSKVPNKLSYPITGNIGMKEFLGTFFNLNQSANLVATNNETTPALSDTITFTTTLNAGTSPSVEISRNGSGFNLVDGGIDASALRMDKHVLVMSVALSEYDNLDGTKAPTARVRAAKELERQRRIRLQEEFADRVVVIN